MNRRARALALGVAAVLAALSPPTPLLALDPRKAITQYVHDTWPEEALPQVSVHAIIRTRDGYLWLGTEEGLVRFDGARFVVFDTENTPELRANFITALLEARSGGLWIGTNGGGLSRLRDGKLTTYTKKDGLSKDSVNALLEDRQGTLWIAPAGGGLDRFEDGRFTALTTKDGLTSDSIGSLLEDRAGSLWIGTPNGLNHLEDGRVSTITTRDGLSSDDIRWLHEDRGGSLWIGTAKGLNRLKDGTFTSFTTRDGLLSDEIGPLFEDREGSLWIGTENGLNRLKGGRLASFRKDREGVPWFVVAHLEDRDGNLWIGTPVGLYHLRAGTLTSITTREGLFDNSIHAILEDGQDNLWMSSNKGVFRASRKELIAVADGTSKRVSCVSYGRADGMRCMETNESAMRARDGRLWFPTVNGVVVVDPAHLPANTVLPPVAVEEVLVDGKVAPRRAAGSPLRVPPGAEKLEIHYTALSLAVPKRVRFRYRLEGFDRDWVEAGIDRIAHYTNLPPRPYAFRVIACNDDGLWNETGASLAITLLPRFWQTRWFRGLEALAGLGALAGVLLLQRRRLRKNADHRRKTEELEQARRVQLALLPREPLTVGGWTVAGGMQTATEVGGDYYGYLEVGGRLCVVIGDATGHGMASGLVVGMLKAAVATLSRTGSVAAGPEVWLAELNAALRSSISQRGLGVCLGISLVDTETGEVELGMAGVPHPFHVTASGRVDRLQLSGTPLGYLKRLLPATASRTLEPGDRLVLITDGLIEQVNAAGEEWGYAGVEAALAKLVAYGAPDAPAGTIAEELLAACEAFGAGQPRSDDRTAVVLARRDASEVDPR